MAKKLAKKPARRKQAPAKSISNSNGQKTPEAELCALVGIGASAGGLEACMQLLGVLPANCGLAIIIVQHLSPTHQSVLPELLATKTPLKVVTAEEGAQIEAGHVYVIPPNSELRVEDRHLKLRPRPQDRSQYTPINVFFKSLAEGAKTCTPIAVILSGTGSDGAEGMREVKASGGITIVQDPKTARYDGMPRAAMQTGAVDHVLSPENIARELIRVASQPELMHLGTIGGPGEAQATDGELTKLFGLLRKNSGVDFTHYKQPTIRRRLKRRMTVCKINDVAPYLEHLEKHPEETDKLFQDLLIHVTRFFRDPDSFAALAEKVFPQIFKAHNEDSPVRVWVPGCSTGEEVYSVAIAMMDWLSARNMTRRIQIFGTDLSREAIEYARAGIYPDSIMTELSREQLTRYFSKTDGRFTVHKTVRDICVFAPQDVTRDPPFSRMDLILCRNLMIYLDPVLQRRLISVLHYALDANGHLMLGSAETVGTSIDLFSVVDKRHKIYGKKSDVRGEMTFRPTEFSKTLLNSMPATSPKEKPSPSSMHDKINTLVLDRYAPPAVVIDHDFRIIEFRGQTGAFLEPVSGHATLDIMRMVREGLRGSLRVALHEARRTGTPARKDGAKVTLPNEVAEVAVQVLPLHLPNETHYLVLFEKKPVVQPEAPIKTGKISKIKGKKNIDIARLEKELAESRDQNQRIIQDLEAANEELQSANEEIMASNEELQSANEELQSTNEELDTAREELESTNEELNTVNDELQARNEEISRANSDLVNLLNGVQLAIVIVTGDLRIRRYTPLAERLFNLIPADMGRQIVNIKPNIVCPDLEQMIRHTIDTVNMQEREVQDVLGNWYSLRIRPYKDNENRISGAVLMLVDITVIKQSQIALRFARDYSEAIVETVREPLVVLDGDMRVKSANKAFFDTFQVSPQETLGQLLPELGNRQWNSPVLRALLDEVLPQNKKIENYRVEHVFPTIGRRVFVLNARRIENEQGRPTLILLAMEDVT